MMGNYMKPALWCQGPMIVAHPAAFNDFGLVPVKEVVSATRALCFATANRNWKPCPAQSENLFPIR